MKKSLIITCNAITVFFLNFIYYVCSYYPKHIVEFSSWESVFGVLWNLLFYFLLFSILIIALKKDKTIFSSQLFNRFSPIMERFEITLLLKLFAVQMAVDFVYLLSAIYLKEYTGFIGSVLTLAGWFAIYFVATKNKLNLLNNKKYFVWTLITCALVFAIAIYLDYRILDTFICYTERYQANSAVLQNAITNIDYFANLKNFVVDTIIGVTFVIFHFASINPQNTKKEKRTKQAKELTRVFTRGFLLIIIAVCLIVIRLCIFPYSTLKTTQIKSSHTKHYMSDDRFYASSDCFMISRLNGYGQERTTFQKTTIKIYCNERKISNISIDGAYKKHGISISGNQMTMNDKFTEYEINEQSVFVLEDLAICYHENSTPKVVEFKEIGNQEESAVLTATIKKLVSDGNVLLFVNSYEYLEKYDSSFANSIAERYSNARFTANEKSFIDRIGYRTEYLQSFFSRTD